MLFGEMSFQGVGYCGDSLGYGVGEGLDVKGVGEAGPAARVSPVRDREQGERPAGLTSTRGEVAPTPGGHQETPALRLMP